MWFLLEGVIKKSVPWSRQKTSPPEDSLYFTDRCLVFEHGKTLIHDRAVAFSEILSSLPGYAKLCRTDS